MGKRSKDDRGGAAVDEVSTLTVLPGPLAPWRLCIVVGVSSLTTGMALVHAAESGNGLDLALLRSFGIAFVTWIALGKINRVIGQVETDRLRDPSATRLRAVADWQEPRPSGADADHEDSGRSGRAA